MQTTTHYDNTEQCKFPIQPIYKDPNGRLRFTKNRIVHHLHKIGQQYNCGLNELAEMDFTNEEWCQFAQLIGYSLSGYSELNYVDNAKYNEAIAASKNQDPRDSKIVYLEGELKALRKGLIVPMARLFEKHPDDFKE